MQTRPRTPIPSPPRRGALVRGLVVAALSTFAVFPAGAEDQLTVTGVDPDGTLPGEPVAISGEGFGRDPEALFTWVDSGDGGFPFEVTEAFDGRIDAILGEVPSAATGAVKVWKGNRHPLADRVVLSQGRLFSASDGEVFVSSATALGPAFSSFGGSPGTHGSVMVQGEARLDLGSFDFGGGDQRVRVTAVIETGEDSGNDASQGSLELRLNSRADARAVRAGLNADSPAWAATLTVGADAPPPTAEALAAGLAEVLETQLGSVGLTARAEGTEVVVDHALGIRAGFLNLTSD